MDIAFTLTDEILGETFMVHLTNMDKFIAKLLDWNKEVYKFDIKDYSPSLGKFSWGGDDSAKGINYIPKSNVARISSNLEGWNIEADKFE